MVHTHTYTQRGGEDTEARYRRTMGMACEPRVCLYCTNRGCPTTNGGMQNGRSWNNVYTHCIRTMFVHVWCRFVCSLGAYYAKFLHRTSVGSLLRVRCWLGGGTVASLNAIISALPSAASLIKTKQRCSLITMQDQEALRVGHVAFLISTSH